MAAPQVTFPAFGSTNASFIVSEGQGYISREEVTIEAGSGKLPGGMILMKNAAGTKFVPFDGTRSASAVLYQECDTTGGDVRRTVMARHCELQRAALSFKSGVSDPNKGQAYASLAALAIVMR